MSDAANPEDTNTAKPADSPAASWLDRLPPGMRNYAVLGRYDRPIGIWLLFWPCALGSIAASIYAGDSWPNLWQIALLFIGAAVMRAAGCTYNDIVDRDIDAQVARTRGRPVAAGRISVKAAWGFLVAQSLVGFLVLIQFNGIAILVGLGALALVAAYPFMKRLTDWPQAWLGLTFNWGVLVAWTATTGALNIAALLLYGAGIAWTLGYDTIYAAQDVEDDALVGVRSTARLFG
ncbi:MAG: UbiA family prenyltransferase, partial [Pseudomonadota bacterium]